MASRLPFYDGALTLATQHGPVVTMTDPVTFSNLYTITYHQRASYYKKASTPGTVAGGIAQGAFNRTVGGYLVEWGEPKCIGGEVLEFTRTFAAVPKDRFEFESFGANYQSVFDNTINDVAFTVNSRVDYTYFHALNPFPVAKLRYAPRFFMDSGTVQFRGELVDPRASVMLGEDELLSRWKGFIWEKKSRIIPVHVGRVYQ